MKDNELLRKLKRFQIYGNRAGDSIDEARAADDDTGYHEVCVAAAEEAFRELMLLLVDHFKEKQ